MNGQIQLLQIENVATHLPGRILYRITLIPPPPRSRFQSYFPQHFPVITMVNYIEECYAFFIIHLREAIWGQILWSTTGTLGGIVGSTRRLDRQHFNVQEFWERMNYITQSSEELTLEDLTFFVEYQYANPLMPIRGECSGEPKGTLKISGGPEGFCFIYSLLIAFRNDRNALGKFTTWKYKKLVGCKKMMGIAKSEKGLAQSLRKIIGEPVFDKDFFDNVVRLFPKYKIIMFKNHSTHSSFNVKGGEYKVDKKYRICLDYHKEVGSIHVNYITDIKKYLSFKGDTSKQFCDECFGLFPSIAESWYNRGNIENHQCKGSPLKCKSCLRVDCQRDPEYVQDCHKCLNTARNPECFEIHNQSPRKCSLNLTKCDKCHEVIDTKHFKNHDCEKPFCKVCKTFQFVEHECINMKAFPNKKKWERSNRSKVDYAYADIESYTKKSDLEQLSKLVGDERIHYMGQTDVHIANYIYMEFQDGRSMEFNNAEEFLDWGVNVKLTSKLKIYFHNGGKYDLRILYDAWTKIYDTFPYVVWSGQKILQMDLADSGVDRNFSTCVSLLDSLYHIPMALKNFSKTFGLTVSKDFFPHKFHTEENQNYEGPIPAKEYFPSYGGKELVEFNNWYDNFQGDYNLRKEMIMYCKKDVEVLRKGCEIYMQAGLDTQSADKKINPFDKITIAGYCMKLYQDQYYPKRSILPMVPSEKYYQLVNDSFHGGDTNSTCLFWELSAEDLSRGERIFYMDKVSMYPSIMVECPLPIGTPNYVLHNGPISVEDLSMIFGFVRVDYKVIKYLHHPVCLIKRNKKLCSSLDNETKISLTSIEIREMIKTGCYEFTKVWDYLHYPNKSNDLFKAYMNSCVGGKTLNSHDPTPNDTKEALDLYEHTCGAIDIRGKPFKKNLGMRAINKLMCNSLWGKFGEKTDRDLTEVVTEETLNSIIEDIREGEDVHIKSKQVHPNNPKLFTVGLAGSAKHNRFEDKDTSQVLNNRGIASFITAYGRISLGEQKRLLNSRSLYNDTDSIIYHHIRGEYDIPLGNLLGQWSSEIEDGGIVDKFVSTGPKSYAYRVLFNPIPVPQRHHLKANEIIKGDYLYEFKEVVKSKGITLTCENLKHVHLDSLEELVKKTRQKIKTCNIRFKWLRMQKSMRTFDEEKQISLTYDKGFVNSEYKVLPFGWNMFLSENDGKYYSKEDGSRVFI